MRALKLYIIGIRNLVVEVDAKYIKGMLAHPDIAPSASINRWIAAILMFHFELVHVPGTHHGPDGLSRRKPQPGDAPEADDDFEDWIDQMNGFMHIINPTTPAASVQPPTLVFATSASIEPLPNSNNPDPASETLSASSSIPYSIIPRSEAAHNADERIIKVQQWHATLKRPENISDADYATFIRYCTEFFVSQDKLWRKDAHGRHKLVVLTHRRLFIIASAHNDVGHHGFYATNSLITERFWWPFMAFDISWFVRTCHICQLRRTQNVRIPPTVAIPAPLFAKVYIDTMHLPPSGGYKYI